ncbi:MAG: hypothetical protein JJE04_17730 [Acidobacteriia bacterium]|nr:hypothetical protein [Terriglobia bacterium]
MRAAACLILAALMPHLGAAQNSVTIALDGDPPVFRVLGSSILPKLTSPNFANIFKVSVDKDGVPPMTGEYAMRNGTLVFAPAYPLEPGVSYRAIFQLAGERGSGVFTPVKPKPVPTTVVESVYPTTSELPENQLKFYVHFSASMSRGDAAKRLHLIEESGVTVKLPFLELDEELWDRDYRRLTVLFDPGRVKRGLLPNTEVGPALVPGKSYSLVIDSEWPDAAGVPLKQGFKKTFHVTAADRTPLDPKTWRLTPPNAGIAAPLLLDVNEPLDAALLLRFIDVVDAKGKLIKGRVTVEREETRWVFTPAEPWTAGAFNLEILTTLEDLAGNKIGQAFDVDNFQRVDQSLRTEIYSLPFKVH